jgi:hypothetical protein
MGAARTPFAAAARSRMACQVSRTPRPERSRYTSSDWLIAITAAGIVAAVLRRKSILAHVVALAVAVAIAGSSRALSEASRIAAGRPHASARTDARHSHPHSHSDHPTKPGVRHRIVKQCDDAPPLAPEQPRFSEMVATSAPPSEGGVVYSPVLDVSDPGRAPPFRQLS